MGDDRACGYFLASELRLFAITHRTRHAWLASNLLGRKFVAARTKIAVPRYRAACDAVLPAEIAIHIDDLDMLESSQIRPEQIV